MHAGYNSCIVLLISSLSFSVFISFFLKEKVFYLNRNIVSFKNHVYENKLLG